MQASSNTLPSGVPRNIACCLHWREAVLVWVAAASSIVWAGCGGTGWPPASGSDRPGPVASRPAADLASSMPDANDNVLGGQAPASPRRPVIRLQITFSILRARVAKGFFSRSGKVWNHLDEEAIPADTAVILQRNGLRVARGKEDSWPAIKALLKEEHVETSRDRMAVTNGLPLMVELNGVPRDQILFLLRPEGPVAGASFPESTNVLRIEYDILLAKPSSLQVRVIPEIRLPRRRPRPKLDESDSPQPPWEQATRVLHELAFEMEVGPDEFFVIGPSPTAELGHWAGSLLLCEETDGRWFESMYFITPRIFRTGRSTGP